MKIALKNNQRKADLRVATVIRLESMKLVGLNLLAIQSFISPGKYGLAPVIHVSIAIEQWQSEA